MQKQTPRAPPNRAIFSAWNYEEVQFGDVLGRGTLANVYAAQWLGIPVVVKQLRPLSEIEDSITRSHALLDFENEQETNLVLLGSGCHPNIVSFFGVCNGLVGSEPCDTAASSSLVFERMDGGELNVRKYGGGHRMKATVAVALGVARALAHAHRMGVMHRDVKPSNVLLDGHNVSKLGDWGLAVRTSDPNKSRNTGTDEFMAPEVFLGRGNYCESADVFSFGIFLFCLGARVTSPYASNYLTPAQAVHAVAHRDLRPTLHSSFSLENGYVELMKLCWAACPDERITMKDATQRLCALQVMLEVEENRFANSGQDWGSWLGFK